MFFQTPERRKRFFRPSVLLPTLCNSEIAAKRARDGGANASCIVVAIRLEYEPDFLEERGSSRDCFSDIREDWSALQKDAKPAEFGIMADDLVAGSVAGAIARASVMILAS